MSSSRHIHCAHMPQVTVTIIRALGGPSTAKVISTPEMGFRLTRPAGLGAGATFCKATGQGHMLNWMTTVLCLRASYRQSAQRSWFTMPARIGSKRI